MSFMKIIIFKILLLLDSSFLDFASFQFFVGLQIL